MKSYDPSPIIPSNTAELVKPHNKYVPEGLKLARGIESLTGGLQNISNGSALVTEDVDNPISRLANHARSLGGVKCDEW